jgi:phosphohistidine phosphatase
MKKLYLVRHAKAARDIPEITDFERPLTIRGRMDATIMGELLKEKGVVFDQIVSSPANRAIMTARLMAESMGYKLGDIVVSQKVYEAWIEDLKNVISQIPSSKMSVMLVGHNPGMQLLAEHLCGTAFEHVPTNAIIAIELPIDDWKEIGKATGKLLFFESPKKHKI